MTIEPLEERTLPKVLSKCVENFPDKPWVICANVSHSYSDVDRQSDNLGYGLSELGITYRQTVLMMLPDDIDIIYCWCALAKLNAIQVPINTHLRGNILGHVINDSQASILIIHKDYLDRLDTSIIEFHHLKQLIVVGISDETDVFNLGEFKVIAFEDCFLAAKRLENTPPVFHDIGSVMYTSGTTGVSKGVMISHAHSFEYALSIAELVELNENDIYYNPLPLFHIAGQWAVYACAIVGATSVISQGFSATGFWNDVRRYKATTTFLLGAMANWLYQQDPTDDDWDNPMQRMLVVPLLPEIEKFKSRFDVLVSTTWGSTEINVPTRSSFNLANNKTCGWVAQDRYEVRIVDENDMEVSNGAPGEALVRAKHPWTLMAGYWNNPKATVEAWRNQWVHSGDMLMRDENHNLYFIDRVKDAIRRRGENISSMEVENEINSHPDVLECAVIPVESEDTEQEVMAVVVLKQTDKSLDYTEFVRYLEPRMAYFMIPRYIEVIEQMPKTQTGKIQKYKLRENGVGQNTWDRVAAGVELNR